MECCICGRTTENTGKLLFKGAPVCAGCEKTLRRIASSAEGGSDALFGHLQTLRRRYTAQRELDPETLRTLKAFMREKKQLYRVVCRRRRLRRILTAVLLLLVAAALLLTLLPGGKSGKEETAAPAHTAPAASAPAAEAVMAKTAQTVPVQQAAPEETAAASSVIPASPVPVPVTFEPVFEKTEEEDGFYLSVSWTNPEGRPRRTLVPFDEIPELFCVNGIAGGQVLRGTAGGEEAYLISGGASNEEKGTAEYHLITAQGDTCLCSLLYSRDDVTLSELDSSSRRVMEGKGGYYAVTLYRDTPCASADAAEKLGALLTGGGFAAYPIP